MADALISAPVAIATGIAAISLIAIASRRVSSKDSDRNTSVALMGVMGAFVFAAQMINFTIPGTGSSGHIIGGVLLAVMLGPWRGFLTLASVLIVQCLVFADGGLMALGCNILNMGATSCLIAYPLVYRPIAGNNPGTGRVMTASIASCIVGLLIGAFMVTLETVASGVTELPFTTFLCFMLPIHFVIGLCEGVATGMVLLFVYKNAPSIVGDTQRVTSKRAHRNTLIVFGVVTLVLAISFVWIASEFPDGLEWSIMQITGNTELGPSYTPPTAVMPEYGSHLSGLVGALIVVTMIWGLSAVAFRHKKETVHK